MELSKETIEFLSNIIDVAKILKIENVILDHECARGHLKEEGSMIIQRDNLPKFEFTSLGISRINILDTRLSLLGNDVSIEAEEHTKDNGEKTIYKLVLSKGKTVVEFKCADSALMPKAPKNLKDPIFYSFNADEESVALLSKAQSAIKAETVAIVGTKSGVLVKLNDIEGDMFNHVISENIKFSPDCTKDKFFFSYKIRVLVPLLKAAFKTEQLTVNITSRGLLNLVINNINVYISPEI